MSGIKTDSTSWRYTQIYQTTAASRYTSHTTDKQVLVGPKGGREDNRLDAVQRLIALIYLRGAVTIRSTGAYKKRLFGQRRELGAWNQPL